MITTIKIQSVQRWARRRLSCRLAFPSNPKPAFSAPSSPAKVIYPSSPARGARLNSKAFFFLIFLTTPISATLLSTAVLLCKTMKSFFFFSFLEMRTSYCDRKPNLLTIHVSNCFQFRVVCSYFSSSVEGLGDETACGPKRCI